MSHFCKALFRLFSQKPRDFPPIREESPACPRLRRPPICCRIVFHRFGRKARPTARAKLRIERSYGPNGAPPSNKTGPQLFRHKSSALFPPEAPSLQAPPLSSTAEICLPADLRYPLSAISLATKIPLAEAWEREWVTPLPSPIT